MNNAYRSLGRSGLIVSPFALGTMTFGTAKWGASEDVSRALMDTYTNAGGNFIDTADVYGDGRSEQIIGTYMKEHRLRDRIVLATKFTFNTSDGNPNAGGNGRKHLHHALEASLARLRTDYIDLYYTHFWDFITPVEEVLQSLGDLVRAGKIRYFGFSDAPAWYCTKAATLAAAHAIPGPIVIQPEYSLIERSIEREHVPAARECGLGICSWGPLGAGFLSGKYQREGAGIAGTGRFDAQQPFRSFTDRSWRALEALLTVAAEIDRPPAQVALTWAAAQPGITALIIGAREVTQLEDNLASAGLTLSERHRQMLDESSVLESDHSYVPRAYAAAIKSSIFGGTTTDGWR